MRLFRPVDGFSTDKIFLLIEIYMGAAFGIGFFTGASMLIFKLIETLNQNQVTLLAAATYTVLLLLLLTIHIHTRRKIKPELKRRVNKT